ncbi:MAG: hypothetical protein R3231_12975, partial [bacterium]|nr:hypothetical protein [bacterium]
MSKRLEPGITHELTFRITDAKTVPALYPESPEFIEMPRVFATGFMVGCRSLRRGRGNRQTLDRVRSSVKDSPDRFQPNQMGSY